MPELPVLWRGLADLARCCFSTADGMLGFLSPVDDMERIMGDDVSAFLSSALLLFGRLTVTVTVTGVEEDKIATEPVPFCRDLRALSMTFCLALDRIFAMTCVEDDEGVDEGVGDVFVCFTSGLSFPDFPPISMCCWSFLLMLLL